MAKDVSVLLLENVKNLGNKGDVVQVAPSYARNVLIKKGKAKIADKSTIQKKKAKENKQEKQKKEKIKAINQFVDKMSGESLVIEERVNDQDKLYETIDSDFLSKYIQNNYNIKIPAKAIDVEDIKQVGKYEIQIDYDKIESSLNLEVKEK